MSTSSFPFSSSLQCRASSISVHPGGSTLHTVKCLRSCLCAMSYTTHTCHRHTHTFINVQYFVQLQEMLPLVWCSTAFWEGNWERPERRPDVEHRAPEAGLPPRCPSHQRLPDCGQNDPNTQIISRGQLQLFVGCGKLIWWDLHLDI